MKNSLKRRAIALAYDQTRAPVVVAVGEGEHAESIVDAAQQSAVPTLRDEALTESLQRIAVGEEVPEVLFEAVAVVLSWAYWLKGKTPN